MIPKHIVDCACHPCIDCLVTCEEDESEDVGAAGVLAADLPRVEVLRAAQDRAGRVGHVLVAGVLEHGPVLLDGGLQRTIPMIPILMINEGH